MSQILFQPNTSFGRQENVASAIDLVSEEENELSEEQQKVILALITNPIAPVNESSLFKKDLRALINFEEDPVTKVFSTPELLTIICSFLTKKERQETRFVNHSFNQAIGNQCITQLNRKTLITTQEIKKYAATYKGSASSSEEILSHLPLLERVIVVPFSTKVREQRNEQLLELLTEISPALQKHCPKFNTLTLTRWTNLNETIFTSLAELCPQVTHLDLLECSFSTTLSSGLPLINIAFPNLNELSLRKDYIVFCFPFFNSPDILSDLKRFFTSSSKLSKLTLSNYFLSQQCLKEFFPLWGNIQNLSLSNMRTYECLGLIGTHCKKLHTLNLSTMCEGWLLKNESLKALTCPSLTSLTLSDYTQISDASIFELVARHPKLTYLSLYKCSEVKKSVAGELQTLYPQLEVKID